MGKLTDAQIRRGLDGGKAGKMYGDGETLWLFVKPNGRKSWVQRLMIDGRPRSIGLGAYPLVSLREARDIAIDNRRAVRAGRDPLAEKRKAKAKPRTFAEAEAEAFKAHRAAWRSGSTSERNWRGCMANHVLPVLGDLPVSSIEGGDVLKVLVPIWSEKPTLARLVRRHMASVFKWAMANGWTAANPCGESIDGALPKRAGSEKRQNHKALPHGEVAAALARIEAAGSALGVRLTLAFVAHTAARPTEAREATWQEIDIEAAVWTIPAERMKSGRAHQVPLSDAALGILERAKGLSDGSGYVFPSPGIGKPAAGQTLAKRMRTLGINASPHGFRSSFRDWCAETGKPREVAEAALAHVVGGTEGAYFRSDLFKRRRSLMAAWSHYLTGEAGAVVEGNFPKAKA